MMMLSANPFFCFKRRIAAPLFNAAMNKFYAFAAICFLLFAVSPAAPGSGGPDGFGYQWKDSDEPGGPSFNYIYISSSGTLVSGLSDDNFTGPFPIGFTFNFYGSDYTEFYIASNGLIGFGSTAGLGAFTNRVIPTSFTPNNFAAWLWDDLIPRSDTEVYYQNFADKLVIQFVQYGSRSLANERVNAEVVLYPSGKILLQYADFTASWPLTSATVGIENGDGTDGLNVVYNAAYLHNSLAVEFSTNSTPPSPPDPPTLFSPNDGATGQPTTLTLQWNAVDEAASYRLQTAIDSLFNDLVFDDSTITATSKQVGPLANSTTHFWRVNAKNAQGTSAWSLVRKFITENIPQPPIGAAIAGNTKSGFRKSNQSKVFYHDSQWWAIALNATNNHWYIWRYNGGNWIAALDVQSGAAYYCDAVLNASTNKLLVFASHKSAPYFRRFSYTGGTWALDAGYPIALADFTNADQNNPVSLARAKNGELWIFRVNNKILEAKRSSNGGQTWSAPIAVKAGLTTNNGTTDAAAFTANGKNYIGVAYAERDTIGSKFGFLMHRDSDPSTTWTDESAALVYFGSERAYNQLCLTADADNRVYLFTRNAGFIGKNPRNTLYKRAPNGTWQKFKVNSTRLWKTPAIAIDATNNRLYCMGVNNSTLMAEYKTCLIGQEAKLDTATTAPLFSSNDDDFDDLSAPAANVDAISGLMICGDNTTANDIWFRHLALGNIEPVVIGAIGLSNNEINANSAYTISLTLSNAGGLNAGSGTINLRFPNQTVVPNAMTPGEVLVDGAPAAAIISNSSTRQVTVTVPANLANNQSFSLVFNAGAGLENPINAGSYKLTAWTSAQPAQVNSPNYDLTTATTTVTPATVALAPGDAGSPADYTLAFNLGDRGRMLSGSSTFVVEFDDATGVTNGALSGVTVNAVDAAAAGDSSLRKITITLPATVSLDNNAAVALFLPGSAARNPFLGGAYTLNVSTSVEPTAMESNPYEIIFLDGAAIPNTTKNFDRNNQSKMFYHGGAWWVTAQAGDLSWYLWKFDAAGWTQTIQLHASSKVRPDCILVPSNNKAYIILPGGSATEILRLSFASGNWTIDSGYPAVIPDFSQSSDHGINLVRANNGNLWVFRIINAELTAKRSTDGGQSWSSEIIVKSGLNSPTGLTDAVAFKINNSNCIGVGYAENSAAGSIYGFLRHFDADANDAWTDETAALPQFSGTTSDDHISMAVHNNTVLMVVKTNGGGPTTANVGLLRRDTAGNWFQHPILLSTGWTRPTLAVDAEHGELYVFGTREQAPKVGEMKHVPLGNYDDLLPAPIDTIFSNDADDFFDISVAAHAVDGAMDLLVCYGNDTRDELWYNLINLNEASKAQRHERAGGKSAADENFEGVQVYPNPFNPDTFFRFKLRKNASVKLRIFNLSGQLVRALIDEQLPKGIHQRRWNGRNHAGQRVASGLYLYRLQVGERVFNGRVQMIK